MDEIKKFLTGGLANMCTKLLIAALIIVVGFWMAKLVSKIMRKGKLFSKVDAAVKGFAENIATASLKVLTVITAAAYLGVPMASVVAVLGSAGLALGLAVQGGLSNIAGGVTLIINRPFSLGDYVTIGDQSGTVKSIGIYYTTLVTPDNKNIVIPNGTVTSTVITDFTATGTRRLDLDFSVSYSSDTDTVRRILLDVAEKNGKIIKDPAPAAMMTGHGDSAIIFRLRVWTKTEDYWDVNFQTLEDVKKAFDNAGIEIPFPQIDVHINK